MSCSKHCAVRVTTVVGGAVAGQRSHTSGYTYKVATAGAAGAAVAVGMAAAASGGGTTADLVCTESKLYLQRSLGLIHLSYSVEPRLYCQYWAYWQRRPTAFTLS